MNRQCEYDGGVKCLDEQLDRALAAKPAVSASAEFVTRVMASLPPDAEPARATSHYGQAALIGSGIVLALLLAFLMLRGVAHQPVWLPTMLSFELALLALGGGAWRRTLRWPVSRTT